MRENSTNFDCEALEINDTLQLYVKHADIADMNYSWSCLNVTYCQEGYKLNG